MTRFLRFFALLLSLASTVACSATRVPEVRGEAVADPAALEQRLREASLPAANLQVNFAWTLEEGGSSVRGRGVVRVDAPERIRLDLFGPRGETYLVAALVGNEYRLPAGVTPPVALPSPSLLWGAMGIFEPPATATLTSATTEAARAELRYQTPDDHLLLFTFEGSDSVAPPLVRVERASSRGIVETVAIQRESPDSIRRSEYRDWTAFRNLTLEPESVREMPSFPEQIWRPDA